MAIDGEKGAGQSATGQSEQSQGGVDGLQTGGHVVHESISTEGDAIAEEHEGDNVASETVNARNASVLEAIRSCGTRDEATHGKGGRRATEA